MASQQDRPPVDEGPIPFFAGSDDKDPFGSLHQPAAPASQSKDIYPPKDNQTPSHVENPTVAGDASALFGESQEQPSLFGQASEPYQPSQPIQASPFDSQDYSGSNTTASFFDQPATSSFFGTQPANVSHQSTYDYSQHQQGDQQVPNYAAPVEQQYEYQQVPSADQPYDQQYAYGQQYDPAANNAKEASNGYSYESTNQYAPQHEQPPTDPYAAHNNSAHDSVTYSQQHQHQQEDSYAAQNYLSQQQQYDPSAYAEQQQQSYQPQQEQQSANQDPYAAHNYSSHDQQQQYDPATYSENQQSYDPSQQQQFDPNVHYYYDEAGQLHYYDPNTNQEYDFNQYDYSQQYEYDQSQTEAAPAETVAESLDNVHPEDHAQYQPHEVSGPFEQPAQDLQAAHAFSHVGDASDLANTPIDLQAHQEEPLSEAVNADHHFAHQDNGHSFFDDNEQYNPEVEDNFVAETTPDTGDLDDLVLGADESAQEIAPPPKATPAFEEPSFSSEEVAVSAPAAIPEHNAAASPEEYNATATEQSDVAQYTLEASEDIDESAPYQEGTSDAFQHDISAAEVQDSEPSSLMSSFHLPQTHPTVEAAEANDFDNQHLRRDSTRSHHHAVKSMDVPSSEPTMSSYSAYEPPQSVQSSLSPPPSVSSFSVTTATLLPCPDPECQGENPPKAKFCCECGRQLAALSRAPTPAVAGQQPPLRSFSTESSNYFPTTGSHNLPQSYVPTLPNQHITRSGSPLASVSPSQDPYHPQQGYYGAESYDPYQQQYGTNDAQYEQQYDLQYDEQHGQQYDQHYDQQYDQQQYDQQYGAYGMVEPEVQAAPAIEDPLNRARGCPIAVFGFGGKLCLMFPHTVQRYSGGYSTTDDRFAPIQKVMPGDVTIRNVKDSLNKTDTTTLSHLSNFIGPVLMDSKTGAKAKKKEAIKYMNDRVESIKAQSQDLHDDDTAKKKLEARALLWRVVIAFLEVEGPMADNSKLDDAIRNVLFPTDVTVKEESFASFTVPADGQQTLGSGQDNYSSDMLETLQGHLMRGDREAAVRYAIQEDLWAHALIISSCVNKDLWKEVVNGFVERDLSSQPLDSMRTSKVAQGDRQGLRVLYALFSGQGAKAISELLVSGQQGFNRPGSATAPFYSSQAPSYDLEKLSHWQDTLALILANRTPRDFEAITALGDILRDSGLDEASQICYLVSPQSSIHGGIDTPNVRLTLLGASNKHLMWHDLDAIHLTELWEFAASTKQPSGAQGLPFLQGYKLVLAWILADHGYIVEAQRYCEAMAGILKANTKGSPYLHKHLLEKLKELNELCEMSGHGAGADSATSWLKQKIPKPTLDSIWGSLEGKFNKFVSGEDLPSNEPEARKSTEIVGSTVPETTLPARSASAVDMRYNGGASADWSRRAATPQSGKYGTPSMRPTSPAHQFGLGGLQGFSPLKPDQDVVEEETTSLQADSYRSTPNPENTYSYGQTAPKGVFSPFGQIQAESVDETQTESYQTYQPYGEETGGGGWWSGGANDMPDAGTNNVDTSQYNSNSYQPTQYEPQQQQQQQSYEPSTVAVNYGDDDLGLGNSIASKANQERTQTHESAASQPTPQPTTDTTAAQSDDKKESDKQEGKGSGWGLFSIFSRSNTATPEGKKSVRANLGEESSFYYDAELKRWVNKKAGPDSAPATPPPPPPRGGSAMALTSNAASPSPSATPPINLQSTPPTRGGPPPAGPPPLGNMQRAVSAPTHGPPVGVPAPSFSTPSPPSGAGGAARKPGAGRKPMRSRYVDVFNQTQ